MFGSTKSGPTLKQESVILKGKALGQLSHSLNLLIPELFFRGLLAVVWPLFRLLLIFPAVWSTKGFKGGWRPSLSWLWGRSRRLWWCAVRLEPSCFHSLLLLLNGLKARLFTDTTPSFLAEPDLTAWYEATQRPFRNYLTWSRRLYLGPSIIKERFLPYKIGYRELLWAPYGQTSVSLLFLSPLST